LSGNILGATELKGPVSFRYKDLKAATKNFSDENKLGEGGFGDVYKVIQHFYWSTCLETSMIHSEKGNIKERQNLLRAISMEKKIMTFLKL